MRARLRAILGSLKQYALVFGVVSLFAEMALQLSGYQNIGLAWVFAISAAFLVLYVWAAPWVRNWIKERSIEPDWPIGEAMDYVADRLGLTTEQDIERKYINPARLLTRQAAAGKLHVWGKRISSQGPELDRREIPAEAWRDRELLFWACQPYIEKPQTRSVIDSPAAYQLTDLHVNATEIKAITWHGDA